MPDAIVGFTGPRNLPSPFRALVEDVVGAIVRRGRTIVVGCARGADAFVREAPILRDAVYALKVHQFKAKESCPSCAGSTDKLRMTSLCEACAGTGCRYGTGPEAYARRSIDMVKHVARGGKGSAIIGFPERFCPRGIVPKTSWTSGEVASGTWSTLALALGMGIPTLIFPCSTSKQDFYYLVPPWPDIEFELVGKQYPWDLAWRLSTKARGEVHAQGAAQEEVRGADPGEAARD